MKNNEYTLRCSECGKFSQIVDRGTYYGNSLDIDPPDELMFCEKCAKKLEKYWIKKGWVPDCYWIKPLWTINADKKLGYS